MPVILIATMVMGAGAVLAANGVKDPTVKAWMELMDKNGASAKTLGRMAGGKIAYDAAAAAAARATLIEDAGMIATAFEKQASDPVSKARPEIWTDWTDFVERANKLRAAAEALDTSSAATIGAGMAAIGGSCKGCHKIYRN